MKKWIAAVLATVVGGLILFWLTEPSTPPLLPTEPAPNPQPFRIPKTYDFSMAQLNLLAGDDWNKRNGVKSKKWGQIYV